ncbi:MAG: hypothetical protein AAFY25_11490 [Pseudomonadota bacterium]
MRLSTSGAVRGAKPVGRSLGRKDTSGAFAWAQVARPAKAPLKNALRVNPNMLQIMPEANVRTICFRVQITPQCSRFFTNGLTYAIRSMKYGALAHLQNTMLEPLTDQDTS